MSDKYCIKDGYTAREQNDFDNEIGKTDECQDEVYAAARKLADERGLQSVIDIGTGSGFKLMKYFSDGFRTFGIDLPPTIEWVKNKYPDREWGCIPFDGAVVGYDLIISADVIEHILDPDELLNFIKACKPKFAVISTPNRDNLPHSWDGPPRNLCHVREWSAPEFAEYITKAGFEIIEHSFPHPDRRDYSTQWVVCRLP